jgi:chromate transporter
LYGVKPVVIAIVAQALWSLARAAVKTVLLGVVGVGCAIAVATGAHELAVLACAGIVTGIARAASGNSQRRVGGALPVIILPSSAIAGAGAFATGSAVGLWPLFLVFLKCGALLFGSGYVLLAFLRADLVERLHWLTEQQLLDAIAVGQLTPGPVFTTATFVGYVLGGPAAAAVATAGIFLPAFIFVAMSGPLVPRIRRSPIAGAVLDGVNAASLALMAVVSWQLGRAALVDALTIGLALASFVLLVRLRINSAWLILAGAAIGWFAS